MVRAVVTKGVKVGTSVGRVAVRTTGFFNVTTNNGTVQGIAARYCRMLHRQDGYTYTKGAAASSRSPQGKGCPSPAFL